MSNSWLRLKITEYMELYSYSSLSVEDIFPQITENAWNHEKLSSLRYVFLQKDTHDRFKYESDTQKIE